MRILNFGHTLSAIMYPGDVGEVKVFSFPGRMVYLDVNTLLAFEIPDTDPEYRTLTLGGQPLQGAKFKPQFRPGVAKGRFANIVLEASHACNLACKYCFAQSHYPEGGNMSFGTAKRALDNFFEPKEEGRSLISFFGGEPLLNWPLITGVTEYVKHHWPKENIGLHVTTNGTLLDEEKVKFLDDNGFSLIVSIDGPADIHDANRPLRSGGGSYDLVRNGLLLLGGKHIAKRTTLRATFTAEHIDLMKRLIHLNWIIEAGYAGSISVEPACLNEDCIKSDGPFLSAKEAWQQIAAEYREAADWFIAEVKAGRKPRFFHYEKTIERIYYSQHAGSECGAGCGYIAVNPAGEIFACHREYGTRIGNVDFGIDESLRAQWVENRIYARKGCRDCWCRYICGGGCRQDSIEAGLDISEPNPESCEYKKLWAEDALYILSTLTKEEAGPIMRKGK